VIDRFSWSDDDDDDGDDYYCMCSGLSDLLTQLTSDVSSASSQLPGDSRCRVVSTLDLVNRYSLTAMLQVDENGHSIFIQYEMMGR